jgi:hypothetical protein
VNEPLVIITSCGHVPRMHAHHILQENGYDNWLMVVHDGQQAARVNLEAGVPLSKIRSAYTPTDLGQDAIAWNRQWIEQNVVPDDTWYVTLDDNIRGWTYLPEPWSQQEKIDFDFYPDYTTPELTWRKLYETPMPFPKVVEAWRELINRCHEHGSWAGGFAIENNYFYRAKKWQTLGYVRTSNSVQKNTGLPFYYWEGAMLEDFIRSVDVVVHTGSVHINRFVKAQKTFFEAGGIGSFEERRSNLVACCEELMRRYPGLLKPVKGADYSLTFQQATRVKAWRKEHGFA